jgi:hypothetical protein
MDRIEPYQLWIGHAGDGRAYQETTDRGIRAIVQLAITEPPLQPPREFVYCRIPLLDGCGNDAALLHLAINIVATLILHGTPTLVCCGAGMSRSPAIAAAAIARVEGLDLDECLRRVTKFRVADVSPGLWNDILPAADKRQRQ